MSNETVGVYQTSLDIFRFKPGIPLEHRFRRVPGVVRCSAEAPANLRQAGTDPSWWRTITADIARREYTRKLVLGP